MEDMMTIRDQKALEPLRIRPINEGYFAVYSQGTGRTLAYADTPEEASTVECAFRQVLAPRFTREEAIAIVRGIPEFPAGRENRDACMVRAGMRAALEALAAAGVFSDCGGPECDFDCGWEMRAKLDAAGIR